MDVASVVNTYRDHLKFRVMCINGPRYVSCSEYNANQCDEPSHASCNISVRTVVNLCILKVFALWASLVS